MNERDDDTQRLRNRAHGRLCDWGQHRADLNAMGFSSNSATERMRQRAHGGDPSTRPSRLTSVEGSVVRVQRTLQTDMAVRALRPKIREAITARYAHDRTVSVWAGEVGISAEAAHKRISRGLLEVGHLLEQWRTAEPIEPSEAAMTAIGSNAVTSRATQPRDLRVLPAGAKRAGASSAQKKTTFGNVGASTAGLTDAPVIPNRHNVFGVRGHERQ